MDAGFDVVIVGGGLAGLTLARQLHLEVPKARVLVCEKSRHPVPEAAFKVGESSVEIGAHYFKTVVDLADLLDRDHLPKLGLRYFFPHGQNDDLAARVELGPTEFPTVPSFQLDRGRFENSLVDLIRASGTSVLTQCTVRDIDLGDPVHRVVIETAEGRQVVAARWVVDASGRAGVLKRKLGLERAVPHGANACWFRFPQRIKVDDWVDNPAWANRLPDRRRWLSTNHLMGEAYWVWLIPLGSGGTSVGIVADPIRHPFARLSRFDRALAWLREFEPQCARIVESHAPDLMDFRALRHFAHGCGRLFSSDRWAMTGESGVFTDPFYSPGSDFIAIGNDFTADLIARDLAGEDIRDRAEAFNTTQLKLFDAFMRLYDGQYPLMGRAQVMAAKVSWDNGVYWGLTALLFFQRRFRQPAFMASIDTLMRRAMVLHARMQQLFAAWGRVDDTVHGHTYANVLDIGRLGELQSSLDDPIVDDDALRARLERNYVWLESMARAWQSFAAEQDPSLGRFVSTGQPENGEGESVDLGPLTFAPLVGGHGTTRGSNARYCRPPAS